jgi:transketolase
MRNAFINELILASQKNEKIVLVVGDLGYGVVEPFAEKFPNRFFNAGVAEQNMMGIAAGLASEGHHVFVYSIANFPIFRCAEQIRNDIDYHNLPVTVVAVGGGLAYGSLGYSHHAIQDYAFMRTLPNMMIASPGDPMEVRACMRYLISNPQPSYLRLGKAGEPSLHKTVPKIQPGTWLPVITSNKSKRTILSTGGTLELAYNWIKSNPEHQYDLHSMPLWAMKNKTSQPLEVNKWSEVLTAEDHLIDGGFGSWMMEALCVNKALLSKLSIRGLDPKICGMVGNQSTLNAIGGLDFYPVK